MIPRERDIERACVHYANCRGVLSRKLRPPPAGWPDRVFILPSGLAWWVEFKRPGSGRLSPLQKSILTSLGLFGHAWDVIDDVGIFQDLLNTKIDRLRYQAVRQIIQPRNKPDALDAKTLPTRRGETHAGKSRRRAVP
jgi:hypothetical protein